MTILLQLVLALGFATAIGFCFLLFGALWDRWQDRRFRRLLHEHEQHIWDQPPAVYDRNA